MCICLLYMVICIKDWVFCSKGLEIKKYFFLVEILLCWYGYF